MVRPSTPAWPMRFRLSDEQKLAAATDATRVFIEAGPGSGKTTVAAERYGVLRFDGPTCGPGLLALSFARSARGELEDRVRRRWGSHALRWPHRVWTLDSLHRGIVGHLLRTGAITWPGGHTQLTVHDSWQGHRGSRKLRSGDYRRVVRLYGRQVVSDARRVHHIGHGYSQKQPYEAMLRDGVCTHDEVRQLLEAAVGNCALRTAVEEFLQTTTKALIVDEVFDGNWLDLEIVELAAVAGVPTTVVGDPWQALYEFRGARPDLVWDIITRLSFEPFQVEGSFRFITAEMRQLAHELRRGAGVSVHPGTAREVDVVLAAEWKPLWAAGDQVLPLAFGQLQNRTDAAMAILLEWLITSHFGRIPTRGAEAALVLGMEPDILRGDLTPLGPVRDCLAGGTAQDARAALDLLRRIVGTMCSGYIPKLKDSAEASRIKRLQSLARRLGKAQLIPGMSIHHAKGREWDHVGVRLSDADQYQLARGLSQQRASDRALYVALTRAKRSVHRV
jgi:DNA helicase-2/ATP-dependent DNA helicase PcrA